MIVLAILSTLGALFWTWITVMANGMSDAPMAGFQGGFVLLLVWILAAGFWLAWVVG